MPRVSTVMTVFNAVPYLEEALDSVLSQTFRDIEFIIIDDGSTDGSAEVLAHCRDPRIRFIRQQHLGVAIASNRGIELATGEYIARQDADDVSLPERFASQVSFLDAHPDIAAVGTGALLIDAHGHPFSSFLPFPRHERLVAEFLRGVCPLIHGSVMVRRLAIQSVGGYKPAFREAEDFELFLRMSEGYRLSNLRDSLYLLRRYEGSFTWRACIDLKIKTFARAGKFSAHTSAEEWAHFLAEFQRDFEGSWKERTFQSENLLRDAQIAFARGRYRRAVGLLTEAFALRLWLLIDLPVRLVWRLRRALLPMC